MREIARLTSFAHTHRHRHTHTHTHIHTAQSIVVINVSHTSVNHSNKQTSKQASNRPTDRRRSHQPDQQLIKPHSRYRRLQLMRQKQSWRPVCTILLRPGSRLHVQYLSAVLSTRFTAASLTWWRQSRAVKTRLSLERYWQGPRSHIPGVYT